MGQRPPYQGTHAPPSKPQLSCRLNEFIDRNPLNFIGAAGRLGT